MKVNHKHIQFAVNYLRTKDPATAYKMTYPRAAIKSLNAAASRLLARPDIAEFIEDTEERIRNRALREMEQEQVDDLKCQLLTIKQKRDVLAKIITGQTKRRKYIKDKYGPTMVEEDQPVYAIIRAINMDTRLEMFYNFLIGQNLPTNRKEQKNFYINAPTLQQQVNILISQTQQQEEEKNISPLERGAGVCPLAPETQNTDHTASPATISQTPKQATQHTSLHGGAIKQPHTCPANTTQPKTEKFIPPLPLTTTKKENKAEAVRDGRLTTVKYPAIGNNA